MSKYCYIVIMFCLVVYIELNTSVKASTTESSVPPPNVIDSDELINHGQELFDKQCASCHGESGMGDGIGAYLLKPHPRDFSLGKFRLVSTVNHIPSDDDLFKTISHGMPGTSMPPWEHLSKDDRMSLVHYVRHLARVGRVKKLMAKSKKRTLEKAIEIADRQLTPGEKIQLPERKPSTMEIIAKGRRLYVAQCAGCHGSKGEGDGREDLKDDAGFPIMPRDFTLGVFKGGADPEDIAYRIIAGIPATPMPSYAEILTPDELWSLVYYVKSLANPAAQSLVEQKKKELVVRKIADELNVEMDSKVWDMAKPAYVALLPLWWRNDAVKGVYVQALHNGKKLAVRMVWEDATINDNVLGQNAFSDGAAVQFSPSADPPFFAMGYWQDPVNIWNWKAWRDDLSLEYQDVQAIQTNMPHDQYPSAGFLGEKVLFSTASDVDNPSSLKEPASPIEDLNAGGFGSLTSQEPASQNVMGRGDWKNGFWEVVYIRELVSGFEGDITFIPGKGISVAFAIWDGEYDDRDGQKLVTIWHKLVIED